MRRSRSICWLTPAALLVLALFTLSGRPVESAAGSSGSSAAVLTAPVGHPPSPFLATAILSLELPVSDLGGTSPRGVARTELARLKRASTHEAAGRRSRILIRIQQLNHDAFAADDFAARAGLLSYGSTAPPPPLG